MRKTLLRATQDYGVEHARCPYCGRRFEGLRYVADVFTAIIASAKSGHEILIKNFGTFKLGKYEPSPDSHDRFHYSSTHHTIRFEPAGKLTRKLTTYVKNQNKEQ